MESANKSIDESLLKKPLDYSDAVSTLSLFTGWSDADLDQTVFRHIPSDKKGLEVVLDSNKENELEVEVSANWPYSVDEEDPLQIENKYKLVRAADGSIKFEVVSEDSEYPIDEDKDSEF